jgi:hypothetical protein
VSQPTVQNHDFPPPCTFYHSGIVEIRTIEEIDFVFQLGLILAEPVHKVVEVDFKCLLVFAGLSGFKTSLESLFAVCVDS